MTRIKSNLHTYHTAQGRLALDPDPTGYQLNTIQLSRDEAAKLAAACVDFLADTQDPKESITALFVGGPLHGEFREVPRVALGREYHVAQLNTKPLTGRDWTVHNVAMEYDDHTYTRVDDIAFDGIKLPFAIFEHESLKDANVKRQAKLLDAKLAEVRKVFNTRRTDIKQAQEALDDATFELDKVRRERSELSFKYGV